MNSRSRLLLATVVFVLLAGVVLGVPSLAAASPHKGTNGWYWPTGTEKLGNWDGFWVYRSSNHSWHMAKDIVTPVGHAVYAIADGVIAESKADAGYGGVLVVWHKAGDGTKFLTVYGHIIRAKGMKKGAKVSAGQVVGRINSANHLHFGIHPGDKYPPDNNPYRGHTYIESQTYGWVDPINFLKTHLAYKLPYTAPALPLVATVSTVSTPTVLGVASESVYWSVATGDDTATIFAQALQSGETTQLAEATALPPLDTTRYSAIATATAFSLYDRQPVLTASYTTCTPGWKSAIGVSGKLANAAGKPFGGAPVYLQRSTDGRTWKTAASATTSSKGAYSLAYVPSRSYRLRVKFTPLITYTATATVEVTEAPQPGLHAPSKPKQSKTGPVATFTGKLDARHTAGAHTVTLRLQQLLPTGWTDALTTFANNANSGGGTRYSRKLTLASGSWRVRASCKADSLHAAQATGWVTFAVK